MLSLETSKSGLAILAEFWSPVLDQKRGSPLVYTREELDWTSQRSLLILWLFSQYMFIFLSSVSQWSSWNIPCQVVQNFWTQHFKKPPSAPHPTAMLLSWTNSSLSPIFPGNIFSVVANKKWALAEITVVYTELNFSLFLFFTTSKNKASPQHYTAVHSTSSFSHTPKSSPLKSLAVELNH